VLDEDLMQFFLFWLLFLLQVPLWIFSFTPVSVFGVLSLSFSPKVIP
jgi:hypothetical protein